MNKIPNIPQDILQKAIDEISKLLGVVLHGVSKFSGDNQNMEEFAQKLQAMKTVLEEQLTPNENELPNKNKP